MIYVFFFQLSLHTCISTTYVGVTVFQTAPLPGLLSCLQLIGYDHLNIRNADLEMGFFSKQPTLPSPVFEIGTSRLVISHSGHTQHLPLCCLLPCILVICVFVCLPHQIIRSLWAGTMSSSSLYLSWHLAQCFAHSSHSMFVK